MRSMTLGTFCVLTTLALTTSPVFAETERPADAEITDWIEEAIAADLRVPGDAISVSTRLGIVTLSGSVPTLAGRSYAILDAQKIYGVLAVIDQLEIDAPQRVDVELEAAVRARIANSAFIDDAKLEVVVLEGVVQLAGQVRSDSERHEAELLACEVTGVRNVENFLEIPADGDTSDPQILKDVTGTFHRDVHLMRLPIEVAVKNGQVTLSGPVGSAYEKARAESRVRRVQGVRAVDNQLRVEWATERSTPTSEQAPRTDPELAATALEQLRQDGRIDAAKIRVTADRGRMVLSGQVPSLRQRRIAEEDVWNLSGVGWVANELTVEAEPRADKDLLEALRSTIALDSQLADSEITVKVEAGAVTLSGRVTSRHHRAHAAAIAARTRGVERLDNRLTVSTGKSPSDEEIAKEVRNHLDHNWRTAGLGDRIAVDVQGGVVTLSGSVESWAERRSAGVGAMAARGIRMLRNRIVVQRHPYPWQERDPDSEAEEAPDWDRYYHDYPTLAGVA